MKLARTLCLALVALFLPFLADAATATINWTAPTTATDSSALVGAQAITSYQVWVSTAAIPANTTMTPAATLTGTATTTTQTITALPGDTIHARVKACNAAGCSDFSAEATKALPVSLPGIPTSVTVTIQLSP